ncbi:DUF2550 domain-containing protein [Propionicicella superfundia]|uniref:DUF2550 domain-containing protein n=1 Tax=Propionicicella superfundia TaxID=348582 RepID=UPI0004228319|nr:DUF2550 domain-containing protein [Propionicicella superfundia]
MGWWPVIDLVLLVVVLIAPLAWLLGRRRWLTRQGGLFDCSMRRSGRGPSGWVLGVARYTGEFLEWFPVFSLSFRPRVRVYRSAAQVRSQRRPEYDEAASLYEGSQIVTLRLSADEDCELAMSRPSLTGLMSWLESAPPGLRYQHSAEDHRSEF